MDRLLLRSRYGPTCAAASNSLHRPHSQIRSLQCDKSQHGEAEEGEGRVGRGGMPHALAWSGHALIQIEANIQEPTSCSATQYSASGRGHKLSTLHAAMYVSPRLPHAGPGTSRDPSISSPSCRRSAVQRSAGSFPAPPRYPTPPSSWRLICLACEDSITWAGEEWEGCALHVTARWRKV